MGKMKLGWASVTGMAIAALLIGQAGAAESGWLTLNSFSGPPGATLQVSGGGFSAGETIRIALGDGSNAITTAADPGGMFGPVAFSLPLSLPQGNVVIRGEGLASGNVGTNAYYVIPFSPTISVSGSGNVPGSVLTVTGSDFAPNETVNASLASASAAATASGAGAISVSLTIPAISPGVYTVSATGAGSGAVGSTWFYVGGFYPSLTPSAWYVPAGQNLSFTGAGYMPLETVDISIGSTSFASAVANGTGGFTTPSIQTPWSLAGTSPVFVGTGQTSGVSASVPVAVGQLYPAAYPSAWYILPGGTLAFSGSGFSPGETVAVNHGTSTLASFSADQNGNFAGAGAITAAFAWAGTNPVFTLAGGTSHASTSVSVAVGQLYPALTPSNYYVLPGYPLAASGSGFAPGETVTFTVNGTSSPATAIADGGGNFGAAGPFRAGFGASSLNLSAQGSVSHAVASISVMVGTLYPAVSPSSYYLLPHASLAFAGSGFAPNEDVLITLGSTTVATAHTNDSGVFSLNANAPSVSGSANYVFSGQSSGASANVAITVASLHPVVASDNYYTTPGSTVHISVQNFLPNEGLSISVNGTSTASSTADGGGNASFPLVLPYGISGTASVSVIGSLSGSSGNTTITLAPWYPQVSPSAWYAAPGSVVSFTGSGFAPNETVSVLVNGTSTASVAADNSGNFTLSGQTLPWHAGTASYSFLGNLSVAPVGIPITIAGLYPWVTLSSYYGPGGSPLTISAHGFAANEPVGMSWSGTNFASSSVNGAGDLIFPASVPFAAPGDKTLLITGGNSGATASTGFTQAQIYVNLQLGAYAGAPGGHVAFIGSGYLPNEPIQVATDRASSTYSFNADASGNFNDSGFVIPVSFAPGNLTFTVTGTHSMTTMNIVYYVTGG